MTNGRRTLDNGGNGHCWVEMVLQIRAVQEGFPVSLAEHAFVHGNGEKIVSVQVITFRPHRVGRGRHLETGFPAWDEAENGHGRRRSAAYYCSPVVPEGAPILKNVETA